MVWLPTSFTSWHVVVNRESPLMADSFRFCKVGRSETNEKQGKPWLNIHRTSLHHHHKSDFLLNWMRWSICVVTFLADFISSDVRLSCYCAVHQFLVLFTFVSLLLLVNTIVRKLIDHKEISPSAPPPPLVPSSPSPSLPPPPSPLPPSPISLQRKQRVANHKIQRIKKKKKKEKRWKWRGISNYDFYGQLNKALLWPGMTLQGCCTQGTGHSQGNSRQTPQSQTTSC